MASAASLALLALTNHWQLAALFLLLTVLLYIRHASNIGRLARGEEARIGESSALKPPQAKGRATAQAQPGVSGLPGSG